MFGDVVLSSSGPSSQLENQGIEGTRAVNILLVEDDDVDARAIKRAFAKQKIINHIVHARDGIEALSILRGEDAENQVHAPYILLVDINMPRMDGIEFVRTIRKDPKLNNSVVFILTTSRMQKDIDMAYSLNIAGYILKDRVDIDFLNLLTMLDHYWKIVQFP